MSRKKTPKAKQMALFDMKNKNLFGGSLLKKSNPKEKRPVSSKHAMHVVLRSSKARGDYSLLKKRKEIEKLLNDQAKKAGIKLYRQVNVGNHIHILLRCFHRRRLAKFLRSISGLIARLVLGAEKGKASRVQGFWDARPFSRIVAWGRSYIRLHRYFDKNGLEALGFDLSALARQIEAEGGANSS